MRKLYGLVVLVWSIGCDTPPPMACTPTLPNAEVFVGELVSLTACFEAEALPLRIEALSSDERVARASAGGTAGWVRIEGAGVGEAVITIEATDANDKQAFQTVHVEVPNRGPVILQDLPDLSLSLYGERRLHLPDYVSDPDGHEISWVFRPSDEDLEVHLEGETLVIYAGGRGDKSLLLVGEDTESAEIRLEETFRVSDPLAYVTQAAGSRNRDVALIANQEAVLRLFLASNEPLVEPPSVMARVIYKESAVIEQELMIDEFLFSDPDDIDEGDISRSYDLYIPGLYVQPDMRVELEIGETRDPNLISRIYLTPEVHYLRPLDLTVIPVVVQYAANAYDDRSNPIVARMVKNGLADNDFYYMRNIVPASRINVVAHEPILIDIADLLYTLDHIQMLWRAEGSQGYYMGILPGVIRFDGGELGGQAFAPGRTSWIAANLGESTAKIIAHEFLHNLSLGHAPCRVSGRSVDQYYPYEGGEIGIWGYNFEKDRVVPSDLIDVMGYCGVPTWISDYHYSKALTYLSYQNYEERLGRERSSLMVWGGIDAEGEPRLESSFYMEGVPTAVGMGRYRMIGELEDGSIAFDYRFEPGRIADDPGGASFAHLVPVTWDGELAGIHLETPGGERAVLNSETDEPFSMVIENGKVVSMERALSLDGRAIVTRGLPRR